jgi:hypothetical protein
MENGKWKMENSKIITCHVGNGASVTAIQNDTDGRTDDGNEIGECGSWSDYVFDEKRKPIC